MNIKEKINELLSNMDSSCDIILKITNNSPHNLTVDTSFDPVKDVYYINFYSNLSGIPTGYDKPKPFSLLSSTSDILGFNLKPDLENITLDESVSEDTDESMDEDTIELLTKSVASIAKDIRGLLEKIVKYGKVTVHFSNKTSKYFCFKLDKNEVGDYNFTLHDASYNNDSYSVLRDVVVNFVISV